MNGYIYGLLVVVWILPIYKVTANPHREQQITTGGQPPEKPELIECRVFNWTNMTCWWKPVSADVGLRTDQTLYWTLLI